MFYMPYVFKFRMWSYGYDCVRRFTLEQYLYRGSSSIWVTKLDTYSYRSSENKSFTRRTQGPSSKVLKPGIFGLGQLAQLPVFPHP